MASTLTLAKTVEINKRFIYNAPLFFLNDGDMAFSIGDWVRQFLLAPPFAWTWNRANMDPIICQPGQTDYTFYLPDFGWLEKAWILFPVGTDNQPAFSKELEIQDTLAQESVLGQPAFISQIGDDNNGNITFRLMGNPDRAYTLYLFYQKQSKSFSSALDTWDPIPDYYTYLIHQGFLAKVYEYKGDERFAFAYQQFLKQVVAANVGLMDTQKNIFLDQNLVTARETRAATEKPSTRTARGGE